MTTIERDPAATAVFRETILRRKLCLEMVARLVVRQSIPREMKKDVVARNLYSEAPGLQRADVALDDCQIQPKIGEVPPVAGDGGRPIPRDA